MRTNHFSSKQDLPIALRIDDIGASTKVYEIYSKKWRGLANILFLKRLKSLKAWAPYPEMTAYQWEDVLALLRKYGAKLTVGITATWVNYDGSLEPFPEKFPTQTKLLKAAQKEGLVEIANHGLTHCVLQDFLFRPRWFSSNRNYHREFWDWIDKELHLEHIKRSQKILCEAFDTEIVTLIPPGNVYCDYTLEAAEKYGIKVVNCQTVARKDPSISILSNERVIAFHDKEIVEEGPQWLENILKGCHKFAFVKELA